MPLLDGTNLLRGVICVEQIGLNLTVSGSLFENNGIFEESPIFWSGGAAISTTTAASIFIFDTRFSNNSADNGNALQFFGSNDVTKATTNSTILLNNVTIENHSCQLAGCGISIASSVRPTSVIITRSFFLNNALNRSDASLPTLPEVLGLTGGAAALIAFPSTEPLQTSLVVEDTVFFNNHIAQAAESVAGGGVDLTLYRVLDVSISNASFSYGPSSAKHGVVWSRLFNRFTLESSQFLQPSPESIFPTSLASLVDLQEDVPFYGDESHVIRLNNLQFINSTSESVIKIRNVRNASIENVIFEFNFEPSTIQMDNLLTISASKVRDTLHISHFHQENLGVISISDVSKLIITDSFFGPHIVSHSTPWQLDVTHADNFSLANSEFFMSGIDGCTHAAFSSVEVSNVRFQGCSISTLLNGGAIYSEFSRLKVVSSNFTDCRAGDGGAISSVGFLSVQDCSFANNTAAMGGAIEFGGNGDFLVSNSRFEENMASAEGGSIYLGEMKRTERIVIEESSFVRCSAFIGGAISSSRILNALIIDSHFANNTARSEGGAIFVGFRGSHEIYSSTFFGNLAGTEDPRLLSGTPPLDVAQSLLKFPLGRPERDPAPSKRGGAISLPNGKLNVSNCKFIYNAAEFQAGAIFFYMADNPTIEGSVFERNYAGLSGGAVSFFQLPLLDFCRLHILNSLFLDNYALYGGALEFSPYLQHGHADSSTLSNTTFCNNTAHISAGAIYTASSCNFEYSEVIFLDNSAKISGGSFFQHPDGNSAPFDFCPSSTCSITVDWRKTKYKTLWGPYWASGSWTPFAAANPPLRLSDNFYDPLEDATLPYSILTSSKSAFDASTSLIDSNSSQSIYLTQYQMDIGFRDAYNQSVLEPVELAVETSVTCPHLADDLCPFSASGISGTNQATISLLAKASLLKSLTPYDPIHNSSSLFAQQIPASISVAMLPILYNPSVLTQYSIDIPVSITGCPSGYGLSTSANPFYGSCSPCSINSYNIKDDGYCYLCNSKATFYLECEGSTVAYRDNVWASSLPNSNELMIQQCPLGFCARGSCAPHRHGLLCSFCEDGYFQSLFSICSATICATPSITLFIVLPVLIIVISIAFHILILKWATVTLFWIIYAQIAFSMLSSYIDWAFPLTWERFANLVCGYRMGAMERHYLLTFIPYTSIVAVLLFWILILLVSKIRSICSNSSYLTNWVSRDAIGCWRRILRTITALAFVCSFWTIGRSFDFSLCQETIFGTIWSVAPTLSCKNRDFIVGRSIFLSASVPLSILPVAGFFVHLILKTPKIRFKLLSSTNSRSKIHLVLDTLFSFSTSDFSHAWPFIDLLLLRTLFPILQSVLQSHATLQPSILCILLIAACGLSSVYNPHIALLLRHGSTASLGTLAALSVVKQDLIYNVKLPMIATGVTFAGALLLASLLIYGIKYSYKGKEEEDVWKNTETDNDTRMEIDSGY